MITLKIEGTRYRAQTVKQVLDNRAQDKGYRSYNHYLTEKGCK